MMTVSELEMLKRLFDQGVYELDRSHKIIGKGKDHVRTVEVPAELFPDVERLLKAKGYNLINRDTAKLDVTGGAVSRMLEGH